MKSRIETLEPTEVWKIIQQDLASLVAGVTVLLDECDNSVLIGIDCCCGVREFKQSHLLEKWREVRSLPLNPPWIALARPGYTVVERPAMQAILPEHRSRLNELCRRHHVLRLAVFGSADREDFDPDRSDVDLLVDFEDGVLRYAENFFAFEGALTELFASRVDLLSFRSIRNAFLKRSIEADQTMLYAA